MKAVVISVAVFLLSLPAQAQLRRAAAGYEFTGGSSGYTAQAGRVDGSGLITDWLGFYGGGSFINEKLYNQVWTTAGGLEFEAGEEDRFRVGAHYEAGQVGNNTPNLTSSGIELGYLTALGKLDSLGFFYRYTTGTLLPVDAIRSAMVFPGAAAIAGLQDSALQSQLANHQIFQVQEFTTSGEFDLSDKGRGGSFLNLAVTAIDISSIGPALAESLSISFPIMGYFSAYVAGSLEQSSTLGSQQFGSIGVYMYWGASEQP